jgi:hypothetical protein
LPQAANYQQCNYAFEKAVTLLQQNLQYLADNDKVSERFVSMQNGVINALIAFQQQTECIIEALEEELLKTSQEQVREVKKLQEVKTAFEALCIIHGIMDFPMWMQRGMQSLVSQALEDQKSKCFTLPYSLLEMINTLPEEEQKSIRSILFKNYDG